MADAGWLCAGRADLRCAPGWDRYSQSRAQCRKQRWWTRSCRSAAVSVRPTLVASRAQVPSCYPGSDRCPFRTVRTHPAGAAASSPGQTQAGAGSAPVVFVTVRRAGMAVASCVGVCEGPFLRQPHQKGPRGDPAIFGARPVSQQSAVVNLMFLRPFL